MENIKNPFNNFFEFVTDYPREVEELLLHFTKDIAKHLEIGSLRTDERTFIDEKLHQHLTDRIFIGKYRGREAYFNILLEHKSGSANVAEQLFRYLFNGYQKQLQDYQQEKVERKAADLPIKKLKKRLIIPVLIYHGERRYNYRTYADTFDLPAAALYKYAPNFHYIVIDLNQFSDDYIESIKSEVLKVMLLLFKHKGDTNYFRRNVDKILKFVVRAREKFFKLSLFRVFLTFVYNAFDLNNNDMSNMTAQIPANYQPEFKTTADRLRHEGYLKAMAEFEEERNQIAQVKQEAELAKQNAEKAQRKVQEAMKKTEEATQIAAKEKSERQQAEKQAKELLLKRDIEQIQNLVKKFPDFTAEEIADLIKLDLKFVKKTRQAFQQDKVEVLKRFIKETFVIVPHYTKADKQRIEKWGVAQWKEFHQPRKSK